MERNKSEIKRRKGLRVSEESMKGKSGACKSEQRHEEIVILTVIYDSKTYDIEYISEKQFGCVWDETFDKFMWDGSGIRREMWKL